MSLVVWLIILSAWLGLGYAAYRGLPRSLERWYQLSDGPFTTVEGRVISCKPEYDNAIVQDLQGGAWYVRYEAQAGARRLSEVYESSKEVALNSALPVTYVRLGDEVFFAQGRGAEALEVRASRFGFYSVVFLWLGVIFLLGCVSAVRALRGAQPSADDDDDESGSPGCLITLSLFWASLAIFLGSASGPLRWMFIAFAVGLFGFALSKIVRRSPP